MVSDEAIDELARKVEAQIAAGRATLEELPDFEDGRRYRENNVVDVTEITA